MKEDETEQRNAPQLLEDEKEEETPLRHLAESVEDVKPDVKTKSKKKMLPELERKEHVIEQVKCHDSGKLMTAKQLKYSHPRYCKAKQDNDNIIEN